MRFQPLPIALIALTALPACAAQAKAKAKAKPAAAPAAAPAPAPVKMDGDWGLSVPDSDSIPTRIGGAIATMNFLQKQLWKHKLTNACLSYSKIFILTGFANSISFDKENPINIPADSTSASWVRSDDEKFQISLQKSPAGLVLIMQGDGYTLNEHMDFAGDTMTLTTTYVNPKMPDTFSYKQVYKHND